MTVWEWVFVTFALLCVVNMLGEIAKHLKRIADALEKRRDE